MTLENVLSAISGGTKIVIHAHMKEIFRGCMADVSDEGPMSKEDWYRIVGPYLREEVYRINTVDGFITLAV